MTRKTLSTLQTFRGIAAILVLLYHTALICKPIFQQEYFMGIFDPFGAFGVDFFFVLSGFIIFYAHSNDLGSKKILPYLGKRFTRIYPVYWLVTLPIIPLLFILPVLGTQGTETAPLNILKSLVLFPNQSPPVLGVAWTLTHEVLFYLIFGLLFVLLKPKYSMPLAVAWILVTLLSFVNVMNLKEQFYLNFIFHKFNIEFALGMISAYLVTTKRMTYPKTLLTLGVTLFILAAVDQELKIFDIDRVLSFGIASFFIVCGAAFLDLHAKITIPKMFMVFGDASYSIYLTHYPVIIILAKVCTVLGIANFVGTGVTMNLIAFTTLLTGCLFHLMIEKRLLRMLRSKRKNNAILTKAA